MLAGSCVSASKVTRKSEAKELQERLMTMLDPEKWAQEENERSIQNILRSEIQELRRQLERKDDKIERLEKELRKSEKENQKLTLRLLLSKSQKGRKWRSLSALSRSSSDSDSESQHSAHLRQQHSRERKKHRGGR